MSDRPKVLKSVYLELSKVAALKKLSETTRISQAARK
jgi:hypothetical protein